VRILALLNEQIEGKYEILGKLREGGMGAVYKVRHRLLDEVRVVKVVLPQSGGTGAAAERFLNEAKVAIRLRHPNVADLHDFAVDNDGTAFIVMEYIDGWSLLEVLEGFGPPPLSLTLEIARQALRAIAYLHRQQIVHRDISPDNLMLCRDGEGQPLVKLIDLGIAKAVGAEAGLTVTGAFLGKPRYASPEQFEGRGVGPQSDLYSFAIVLYELLTGRCPVHGQDAPSFMVGHLLRPPLSFEEADPRGAVPADLRELVLQALAKKPQERMPGAEELLRSIAQVQIRYPLAKSDFDEVFDVLLPLDASGAHFRSANPLQGSTQVRLNWEFGAEESTPGERGGFIPTQRMGSLLGLHKMADAKPPDARVPDVDTTREVSPPVRGQPTVASDLPLHRQAEVLEDSWDGRQIHRTMPPTPSIFPPSAQEIAASRELAPQISRAPALLAAGIVVALVAAGGLGWQLSRRSSRTAEPPPATAVQASPASPASPLSPSSTAGTTAAATVPTAVVPASLPGHGAPGSSPAVEVTAAPLATPGRSVPKPPRFENQNARAPRESPAPPPPPPTTTPAQPTEPMRRGDFILRQGPGVSEPVPLDLPSYSYPAAAHGSGRKANVRVGVLVDEDGKVVDAALRERDSSGLGFNEAALEAARKTRFQAATRDELPGKMWTELIFEFAE
jgi:serine/threonine-protein kinase